MINDDLTPMLHNSILSEKIYISVPESPIFAKDEFEFTDPDYEWSYDFESSPSDVPLAEPDGLRTLQGIEEINWRLTPVMRALSTPPKDLKKMKGNYGTLQNVQASLNLSLSEDEESTENIPLLTTYDPDAIVHGLVERTNEREIQRQQSRMKKVLVMVLVFALVILVYLLVEGWVTCQEYPMSETFLKLIVIFSLILIVLTFSGWMANCHYLSEIRCLRRGEQI